MPNIDIFVDVNIDQPSRSWGSCSLTRNLQYWPNPGRTLLISQQSRLIARNRNDIGICRFAVPGKFR